MTKILSFLSNQAGQKPVQLLLAIASLGLLTSLPLVAQSLRSIPSPSEAAQQAEQMTPEELVTLELDEEIRDRLRFDPAWQPILRQVQRDIMTLKWGDNQLENPIWKQYGAKVYPLLAYYTHSGDPTRQIYGIVGIRALGQPYTRLWLEQELQRPHSDFDFYLLTANPALLLDPNADVPYEVDWKQEFGLHDPATRDRLKQLAKANLRPTSGSPGDPFARPYEVYGSFNLVFLQSAFPDEDFGSYRQSVPLVRDDTVQRWRDLERVSQPSEAQIQQAIAFYRDLPSNSQDILLVRYLGAMRAGQITPLGRGLLRYLATAPDAGEDQIWAIAELDRHGDSEGTRLLQTILDGDLSKLFPLSRWAGYGGGYFRESLVDRQTQAYYLLLGMVEKYPQSKFARASREYGDLRGRSYFGGEERPDALQSRNAQKTPEQRLGEWQSWLNRYTDHPGADDAAYFVARSLQENNQIVEATRLWIRLMTEPVGDGDAKYLAWGHVRSLLDVGLTTGQLESLTTEYQNHAIAPLLKYALAVRYARQHEYAKALQTSTDLNLKDMDARVLGSYYTGDFWWYDISNPRAAIQDQMQRVLAEQRQRWQRLQELRQDGSAESRYALASDWAGAGGWKNGYLAVWDGGRTYFLPTGDWDDYYCQVYWVCSSKLRGVDAVRQNYQQGSQNAIALKLYQDLLNDPNLSPQLREKTLFMAASTVLWQWEDHPLGETIQVHPLPGMAASRPATPPSHADSYNRWEARYNQLQQDYETYVDQTIAQLKAAFPQSAYIDDLLFTRYAISGEVQSLEQIVTQYPEGDRAREAQFLLDHQALKNPR